MKVKCKIHPTYKVKRFPTSKKRGCICLWLWEAKQNKVKLKEMQIKPGFSVIVEY